MFSVSFSTAVLAGSTSQQRSSSPSDAALYALQKLEEILYSSKKKLSVNRSLKSITIASGGKLEAIDEQRLVDEMAEEFICPYAGMKEDKREICKGNKLLTDLRTFSSHGVAETSLANSSRGNVYGKSSKGKQELRCSDVEELSNRLKFLEEENKIMKQEFLEHVQEKKKLVNEIYQQFQTIYRCLQLENPVNGGRESDGSLIVNPGKETLGSNLSEVVCQGSNSHVETTSDQRTNILTLKEAPEELVIGSSSN